MIPISDESHPRARFPLITVLLIAVNVVVFLYQVTLSPRELEVFVRAYGVVPLEITTARDLPPTIPYPFWSTLFTSMFMHGGWLHIIGNMLYLWVFGDNIERELKPPVYLGFYVVCGLAAAFAQILSDPGSRIPSLGASGAIAGVLGAYLVLHPGNRVNTLIFLGYFIRMVQLPAALVLGFWIVLQFFSGVAAMSGTSGVAYWAHVGGFVAGMVLVLPVALLKRGESRPRPRYRDDSSSDW